MEIRGKIMMEDDEGNMRLTLARIVSRKAINFLFFIWKLVTLEREYKTRFMKFIFLEL